MYATGNCTTIKEAGIELKAKIAKDDFRKSEISSFVEEDNLDDSADNVNGFNADNDFKNKDLNYSYDENKKRQALEDEENPLNDPDDDIDIPAFIRKKMGK